MFVKSAQRLRAHSTAAVCAVFVSLSVVLVGIMCGWQPSSKTFLNPDSAFMLWALKWWPSAVWSGHNPFDANFFAPYGQNLAWTGAVPALALIAAPITALFGPIFAFNAITTFALAANGVLAYLITRELHCRRTSAFLGGLLFFFSSYTWGQLLGHLNLYVSSFAIGAIYVILRRCHGRIGTRRHVCVLGILLALQFGVSNEIFATLVVFGFFAIATFPVLSRFSRSELHNTCRIAVEVILSLLFASILVSPYLYQILAHPVSGLQDTSSYVADPINYLIPTTTNWLLGKPFSMISAKYTGNLTEQGAYLGIPVFLIFVWGWRDIYHERLNRLLFVLLVIIAVSSLGPILTILGKQFVELPWAFVQKLPLIREALPTRFVLYTSLVASVLVARVLTVRSIVIALAAGVAAVIFLLPNISLYRMTLVPDTSFPDGTLRRSITPGSRVLILPTYGFYGFQPALWHEEADFDFELVDGLAGKVPLAGARYLWFYYGGQEPPYAKYQFVQFLMRTGVQFIVSDDQATDPVSRLYRSFNWPSEQYGSVRVTRLSHGILARAQAAQLSRIVPDLCSSLALLARRGRDYIAKGGKLRDLTPAAVSSPVLDARFGRPMPLSSPAANWTDKGYWLGAWGNNLAVGYSPIGGAVATALYGLLSPSASDIYFPYPERFNGDTTSSSSGQFLVVLGNEANSRIRCNR